MPAYTIRPLRNRVAILPDGDPTERGAVVLHNAWREPWRTGVVSAVGSGKLNSRTGAAAPIAVRPGDRVAFGRFAGVDVAIDGTLYAVLDAEEIYGWCGEEKL